MAFKRIITIGAIILLVTVFIFMIFFMGRQNEDVIYPPAISKCPDYWDHEDGSNGEKCKNTFGMKKDGNNISELDLTNYNSGKTGRCEKRDWSINNGLTWDGITNDEKLDCNNY